MNKWLKGLIAAAIGGFAGAIVAVAQGGGTVLSMATLCSAATGAILTTAAYLVKSPLGEKPKKTRRKRTPKPTETKEPSDVHT